MADYELDDYHLHKKELSNSNFKLRHSFLKDRQIVNKARTHVTWKRKDGININHLFWAFPHHNEMAMEQYKEVMILHSELYDIEDITHVLFGGRLQVDAQAGETGTIPPHQFLNVGYINFLPRNENFENIKLVKVEMKIFADMYFDQVGSNNEKVNTFQVFTYNLFDEANSVDRISEKGLWLSSENSAMNYNAGTLTIDGNLINGENVSTSWPSTLFAPGHPFISHLNGNTITINAQKIHIKEIPLVLPDYKLKLNSVLGTYFDDGADVSAILNNTNIEIGDFWGLKSQTKSYETSQYWLDWFCQSGNGYQANLPLNSMLKKAEAIKEETHAKIAERVRDSGLEIFPNPSDRFFEILFDSDPEHSYEFTITDINGNLVLQETLGGQTSDKYILDLDGIKPGIYILKVFGDSMQIGIKKIVKR